MSKRRPGSAEKERRVGNHLFGIHCGNLISEIQHIVLEVFRGIATLDYDL